MASVVPDEVESLIRPFVLLFAVVALALTLGSGAQAYATTWDRTTEARLCSHHDADACSPALKAPHETGRHAAGSCDAAHCCLGAVCVLMGLPPSAALAVPAAEMSPNRPLPTILLTGRSVVPPLDPPRSVA